MKIVRLTNNDDMLVTRLDPYEYLSMLGNPAAFALGALEGVDPDKPDDEDDDMQMVFVGILVGTVTEKMLTIDWLSVSADRQGCGIGEALLLKAFDMADIGNIPSLGAVLSPELVRDGLMKGAETFFYDRLFEEEVKIPGNVRITIEELETSDFLKKDTTRLPTPASFKSLSPQLFEEIKSQLPIIQGAEMSVPSEALFRGFIPEISFLFQTDREASGALILQRSGEYLMPVYFYAESERESAALIIAAMREARNRYGTEQEILLKLQRGKTAALFRSIMPGLPLSRLLVASIEDYRSLKDESDQT
jgi:GNAT superfamily N-acetyltransferase